MADPIFEITGVDRLRWEFIGESDDGSDVVLRFADAEQRVLAKELHIGAFRMSEWHFQERICDHCDEVRVLDQNLDGAYLEFGRFVVQFVSGGKVVGEHVADSVSVRRAVGPSA
jgi:hypothetical protein